VRRLLIAVAVLAVVAAALVAGFAVSNRIAPERARSILEQALEPELGPVSVGAIRPFFTWGFGIEVADLRSRDGDGEPGAIAAERVWVTFSARSLVRRQPKIRRLDARGLRLDAVERADGTWSPAFVERARAARADAAPNAAPVTSRLRAIASQLPSIAVDDALVRAVRADGSRVAVRFAHATLAHDPLGGAPELRADGRIEEIVHATAEGDVAHEGVGGFDFVATLDDAAPDATLAVTELRVDALPARWLGAVEAEGRVSGIAAWTPGDANAALELDLVGLDLRVARGEAQVAFPTARLHARGAIDAARIALGELAWKSDGLDLAGSGSIARPVGDAAEIAFQFGGTAISVPVLRDLVRVATAKKSGARRNVEALRAGSIESFALSLEPTPLGRLRARTEKSAVTPESVRAWTDGVSLELRLAGVELRSDGEDPIRDLTGRFRVEGEKLRIEQARAKIGDRALPTLTLDLDGMGAALAALQQGGPLPAVPPLPGRVALDRWIDSLRRPGSPPRWRRIEMDAEWIEHPALLRALEKTTAVLMPANPGVHIRDAKGFWGGVPFTGAGSFYGGDKSRIEVSVKLGAKRRTGRRRADAEAWGRVRFHADLEKLGDFQAEMLEGVVEGVGDRLQLRRGEAKLRPRGDVTGTADVDLSLPDRVPYRARIEIAGGSLRDLMNDVKLDGGAARGTAEIDAELHGHVQAGSNVLGDMSGTGDLRLRDGEINKRMNVLFAIAQATDTLNPFRSRETIPYDTVDAPLTLRNGVAHTDAFSLQGDALRMVGTGQVDLVHAPYPVEAVIGIFYFKTLDRVIGMFPILNRMLLGPDSNLISTYFAVSGPWADPQGTLIPTKSLASGPASFVLEGLPSFVRGGLSTLARVLTGEEAPPESPPPRPESKPLQPTSAPPKGPS